MLDLIQERITEFESARGVRVLFAIESGSRAWGFPSPDSDYDVRLVFARPLDDYLTIAEKKDTYVLPINDELDIAGWDIRKFLRLLAKSNATPYEWLQSPIVYRDDGFIGKLWEQAPYFHNPKAAVYHYRGLASRYFKTVTEESGEPKLKAYFYIIRPLLAAVYTQTTGKVPPLTLADLMAVVEDAAARTAIDELLVIKADASESYRVKDRPEVLEAFLEKELGRLDPAAAPEKKIPPSGALDKIFREAVRG